MAKFLVIVKNNEGKALSGVTVTAKWDFFGAAQKAEVITDTKGEALFEVNVYNTTLNIEASKSGSIDKATVFVNVLGWATPETVTLTLQFKPFEKGSDAIDGFFKYVGDNIKLVLITGTIIGTVGALIYVYSYAKGDRKVPLEKPKLNLK